MSVEPDKIHSTQLFDKLAKTKPSVKFSCIRCFRSVRCCLPYNLPSQAGSFSIFVQTRVSYGHADARKMRQQQIFAHICANIANMQTCASENINAWPSLVLISPDNLAKIGCSQGSKVIKLKMVVIRIGWFGLPWKTGLFSAICVIARKAENSVS